MALTQMQIIQSLGEAMTWFERELQWGVKPTELPHLCGRIGELYTAMITNGQMATAVNQQGYDVVSAQGERISVKTTSKMNHASYVSFNPRTLSHVDRVIVLRVNTEEMQIEILLDDAVDVAMRMMGPEVKGKRLLPLRPLLKNSKPQREQETVNIVSYHGYTIRELESGTILIDCEGQSKSPVKPILRNLALSLNLSLVNSNGNPLNTRQLGSQVIQSVKTIIERVPLAPQPVTLSSTFPI
ncbi:DUF6998 domain-containing protein [Pseudomonas chlororaphis]|uniref:DUF6998 domain-containing protein n=1 Tax=Pseudomonas chlororaphis subsp. aureofaciens TaxID=587851 RepID=A0AAD0ZLM1_9PSED|nr:hypothetical protein [Pseudomonas chlororaphis]AZC91302.1 hypothetical protein C4K29_5023 [Pseudomonas chlororaphis subsp. piscium]AZE31588.1 hypothetical protein C4K07_4825 [Pseudomonas chlororaphis subsp. aureofaciens]